MSTDTDTMLNLRTMMTGFLAAALLAFGAQAMADDDVPADDPRAKIIEMLPNLELDDIREAPVDGLYEVSFMGQVIYVSADTRFLVKGDIIDLDSHENLTEQRRGEARLKALDALGEESMIVFEPEEVKYTVTVFTDVDCTYCRKFHREMAELNALGVKVRYVFYPRSGPGSKSWQKADWVWCSDDRNAALTEAKAGRPLDPKQCDTPVDIHYDLGRQVGLTGTPAIVLETGDLFPGYLPAEILVQQIETLQAARQKVAIQD